MNSGDTSGQAEKCQVTIRFPQVDRAGIIFYPRYFELILRCFAKPPLASVPVAFKTQFLQPSRLGDRIEIVYERETGRGGWRIVGKMKGADYFSVSPLAISGARPRVAHLSQLPAFNAHPVVVGDWAVGRNGDMHLSRYFEFLNNAVEEWFEDALDKPFHQLHVIEGIGIPTVAMKTHCWKLPRVGDRMTIMIRPQKIGRCSLTFTSWLVRDDTCLIENTQTIVFARMTDDGFETIMIPDDIRARLELQSTIA